MCPDWPIVGLLLAAPAARSLSAQQPIGSQADAEKHKLFTEANLKHVTSQTLYKDKRIEDN